MDGVALSGWAFSAPGGRLRESIDVQIRGGGEDCLVVVTDDAEGVAGCGWGDSDSGGAVDVGLVAGTGVNWAVDSVDGHKNSGV